MSDNLLIMIVFYGRSTHDEFANNLYETICSKTTTWTITNPENDRGTYNLKNKIDKNMDDSDICIIDVTPEPIQGVDKNLWKPNTNVVYEYSRAMALYPEKCRLICNEDICKLENLSFCIKDVNIFSYSTEDPEKLAIDIIEEMEKYPTLSEQERSKIRHSEQIITDNITLIGATNLQDRDVLKQLKTLCNVDNNWNIFPFEQVSEIIVNIITNMEREANNIEVVYCIYYLNVIQREASQIHALKLQPQKAWKTCIVDHNLIFRFNMWHTLQGTFPSRRDWSDLANMSISDLLFLITK
jgi:hypothetical protein